MSSPSDTIASHSSKLEEQARSKGDLSYSYWATTDKHATTEIVPKKLSEGDVTQPQQDADRAGSQHTVSAWNSAGTFEERDVTEWAKQQLQTVLASTSSGNAHITKVSSIAGHANIWFIRGKKRHGFEFNIELAWQAGSDGSSSSSSDRPKGTVTISDASPDDLDDLHMEFKLDKATGDAAADGAALDAAKQLQRPLETALTSFYNEMRMK